MSDSSQFNPVMEPYDARVFAVYLAKAFNGGALEVPPTSSPVWPLVCRMVDMMRTDRYALGAWHRSELVIPRRMPAPNAYRSVQLLHDTTGRVLTRQPVGATG